MYFFVGTIALLSFTPLSDVMVSWQGQPSIAPVDAAYLIQFNLLDFGPDPIGSTQFLAVLKHNNISYHCFYGSGICSIRVAGKDNDRARRLLIAVAKQTKSWIGIPDFVPASDKEKERLFHNSVLHLRYRITSGTTAALPQPLPRCLTDPAFRDRIGDFDCIAAFVFRARSYLDKDRRAQTGFDCHLVACKHASGETKAFDFTWMDGRICFLQNAYWWNYSFARKE